MNSWQNTAWRASRWLLASFLGAIAGLAYALLFDVDEIQSAVRGVFIGAPILLYERGMILHRWRTLIRQAATPIFVVVTIVTYVAMILLGNAAAGTVLHHLTGYMSTPREAMAMSESGLLYSLGVSSRSPHLCFGCVIWSDQACLPVCFSGAIIDPSRKSEFFSFLTSAGRHSLRIATGTLRLKPISGRFSLHLPCQSAGQTALSTTISGIWRSSRGLWTTG